jgi:hypothetical protein
MDLMSNGTNAIANVQTIAAPYQVGITFNA